MKYRAIPEGYMTVGEVAKRMNTTVRTLQYYDKEGVLQPSVLSEGGRRLYTDRDVVRLYQIQSMKYLGFSLTDIRDKLVHLDTPEEVARALAGQAEAIREKIAALSEALEAVEKLRAETQKMRTVDWEKYANIIVFLQSGEEEDFLWLARSMDEKLLSQRLERADEAGNARIIATWNRLCDEIAGFQAGGIAPGSGAGQRVAKEWWGMITEFTGGDTSLLPRLYEFAEASDDWDAAWQEKWAAARQFIQEALGIYLNSVGMQL